MTRPAIAFVVKPEDCNVDALLQPIFDSARAADCEICHVVIDAGATHQRHRRALLDLIENSGVHELFTPTMGDLIGGDGVYARKLIDAVWNHGTTWGIGRFTIHLVEKKMITNMADLIEEARPLLS